MAGRQQPNQAAVDDNERAPLLRHSAKPQADATAEARRDGNGDGTEGGDLRQLIDDVKSWRRRRWISLVASILLITGFVAILLLGGALSHKKRKTPNMNTSICMTPACIHAASEILYNLSPDYKNLDPCGQFDHLVCDGFGARHDIPEDRSSYSTASIMSDNGRTTLRHILESPYPGDSKHSSFSPMNLQRLVASTDEDNFLTMQESYKACMNEATLKEIGVSPLTDLIGEVARSFPVDNEMYGTEEPLQPEDYAKLSDTILLLEQLGVTSFESLYTGADDKNPDVVIVQAMPAGYNLPSPEYYTDNDTLKQYQVMLEQVFSSLLPTATSRDSAVQLAQSVIELEKKIAILTPPPETRQDVTKYYNIVQVAEVGKIGPALGLDKVVKGLSPVDHTPDTMLLAFPEFLANVSHIVSETPKSTIQAFLIWNLVVSYSSYIEAPEVESIDRFNNVLAGRDPETKSERWKTCLSYVDGTVGWILSRFYIEAAFSEAAKDYGDQIILDIKQQFTTKLGELSWMDDSVKKLAANKVHNIDQKIGYPTESPNIMDPDALRNYYKGLKITDSFFGNSLSSNKFSANQTWSALGKPVDRGEWGMQADIVNAYYNPAGNEIVFPAGIMQFPVFSVDLPGYVSYGAFASVAGHELSHAFDNSGRHYDENGNFTDWWTNRTVEEFDKRADCFVDQYNNFTIDGNDGKLLHVNGKLTLGENIADAGGVAAAFAAWKKRDAANPDQSLPGLDHFTHDQLFFVFYANWWCGKVRREQAINYIFTDPHSPAFARILGTTANSRAFRESFDCPVKEPTCELW
ncbi:putative endothelin-converting enzyme [Rosellinia necatrix]|uniref:Putative endothelin-converting enzyme n=1 Tax=Rosellinia necatrix TaxID=77044 RepID=A0A1W2TRB6_ROSNE|nr:putative endothelin-converting enzyme [Rosellinia necatrix]